MPDKKTTIKDLKLDPKNANKHSEYGSRLLENSVRENGFGRSILISNDNVVIAGNGTVEGAGAIGMENVRIVETDGNEIIAVKRKDVKSGTAAFYKMALADNVVAQKNIVLDVEVVEAIVEEYPEVKAWGGIVTDPPGQKDRIEDDKEYSVATFKNTGTQANKLKRALKISKDLNKTKFANTGNKNENANALQFIVEFYLKAHKASK
jgi:hypothetical protein